MTEFLFRLRTAESPGVIVKAPDISFAIVIAKKQLGSFFKEVVSITNAEWEAKYGSSEV